MSQRASTVNGARLGGWGMFAGEKITKPTRIFLRLHCTPPTLQPVRFNCSSLSCSWQLRRAVARTDYEGVFGHGRTRPDRAGRKRGKKPQIVFDVAVR